MIMIKELFIALFILMALPNKLIAQKESNAYYQPTWESLQNHNAPKWYHDAKFGIFIHWGLYSVPAWATPIGKPGDFEWEYFYKNNPYAEWYLNTLKIPGSPTQEYHKKTYGEEFDYYDFIPLFNQAVTNWKPEAMAEQIKASGAKYVVLTSKHHDGFTLWPSRVLNYNFPTDQAQVDRDLIGELAKEVRRQNLKMGIYYSGGLDWSFNKVPVTHLKHVWTGKPQGADYCAYADAHLKELIYNYKPDVLWNDIGYPKNGDLKTLLANYFFLVPEGTVNNRWDRKPDFNGDFITPEYSKLDSITPFKWETCRGIGFSFGYNQLESEEEYMSSKKIIELLIDIVSKNGNLLLNIGPKADGTIPEKQLEALSEVGKWLKTNGEGIYGTQPWKMFGLTLENNTKIHFTQKENTVYVFVSENIPEKEVKIPFSTKEMIKSIDLLGFSGKTDWKQKGEDLILQMPERSNKTAALCYKLTLKN